MKKRAVKYWILMTVVLTLAAGCSNELDLLPPGEFSEGNVLQSEAGIEAVLYSAYRFENITFAKNTINMNEVCTDMGFNTGGGENRTLGLFVNFTWDPTTPWIYNDFWLPRYRTIRDANVILDNIGNSDINDQTKALFRAEARYLRAAAYAGLYTTFGPVPLRTTGDLNAEPGQLSRATSEEILSFVEAELNASVADLPNPGSESQYGRATKGHALGVLTKFLLNTKQWNKVLTSSQQLMDLEYYGLFPVFRELFFIENERNREIIVSAPRVNVQGNHTNYQNGAFPPGFRRAPNIPEFEWRPGMANWATQYRLRDAFVDSYDPGDARLLTIVREYVNAGGQTVNLRDNADNMRSLKYFDDAQTGNFSGLDLMPLRYADILLSRAEALNEINGPTQESVDLVNRVRIRAGVAAYTIDEVGSTNNFRDLILAERGWEFVAEGKRREDLIRHGKLISNAQDRGISAAAEKHNLLPIPQNEINANPNVAQNKGYE
ncbi:RagB/SusD family nutrient uptake outer membrane protein [Muricauda sp. SCSIO 64092]|uniref:RagB/SusD family nutrient uptake outer membrane protein n=1 Tax=Allomuricauda sp. SCSIO 64092 TaxID=2908842 RepID=UPI001FF3FE62|nr:RagB/SusD family nutrient uptake outer membrane protein [Muricauda sp. SCSIO 64092]UOY08060.1 RagB/SusD family nutrient uptake outer membrane protein [Muricauda sp. SCSIO 64092]